MSHPAATVATIRTKFPVFADATRYPDALVQAYLDEASESVSPTRFTGAKRAEAVEYLAAHLLALSGGSSTREVASVTAGQASVTYAAIDLSRPGLARTPYGARYLALIRPYAGMRVVC